MKKIIVKRWYYVVLVVILLFFVGCAVSKLDIVEKMMHDVLVPEPEPVIEKELQPPRFESEAATHIVEIYGDGFSPKVLSIKKGDTVTWKNMREGKLKTAAVVGTKSCVYLKGNPLQPQQTFVWTFEKVGKCTILEAVTKTQFMDIMVVD